MVHLHWKQSTVTVIYTMACATFVRRYIRTCMNVPSMYVCVPKKFVCARYVRTYLRVQWNLFRNPAKPHIETMKGEVKVHLYTYITSVNTGRFDRFWDD